MADNNNTSGTVQAWDEKQYEAAMAHLESLQDQLTALRTTIPSLIRPLSKPHSTKAEAFNGMKKAAVGAVTDVKDFRATWEGQQTQEILARARESREQNKDLSAGSRVPIYGWTGKDNESHAKVDSDEGKGP